MLRGCLKYAQVLCSSSALFLVSLVGKTPRLISLSVTATATAAAGGVLVSLWKTCGQAPREKVPQEKALEGTPWPARQS